MAENPSVSAAGTVATVDLACFETRGRVYGIDVLQIREIVRCQEVTPLPRAPELIEGVIDLRGVVIPVIDLRLRFDMAAMAYTDRTCIIVVEIQGHAGTILIGIVVDSVSEVLNIKGDDIEDTPTFGTQLDTAYIFGMAKMEDGVKILLDIDKVLNAEEIRSLEKLE